MLTVGKENLLWERLRTLRLLRLANTSPLISLNLFPDSLSWWCVTITDRLTEQFLTTWPKYFLFQLKTFNHLSP